jgi:glutathione peroxidase
MIEETAGTVYQFSAPLLDGTVQRLDDFDGRVLLIVNTASKCGFTTQLGGLEELYRTFKDRGFMVLGFPSNQFGAQEPGTEAEIGAFCEKNYGVSFPLFAKIDVNGSHAHPLYDFLKRSQPGRLSFLLGSGIQWNFTKFLIDRRGHVAERYGPSTKPKTLTPAIERLLNIE